MAVAVIEEGLFRGESRQVRFAFSHGDFVAAVTAYAQGKDRGPLPEVLRTYVHELTHAIQYASTPYGLFLHHCRTVQTRAAIHLVKILLRTGHRPELPLLGTLPSLPGADGQQLATWLSIWVNVEFLIAQLAQDPDMQANLVRRVESERAAVRPPLLLLSETLWGAQEMIANFIDGENALRAPLGQPPWDQAGFDRHAIAEAIRAAPSSFDRAVQRSDIAQTLLGGPWSVAAILESAATASEFTRSGMDLGGLRAWLAAPCDPAVAVYRSCLQRGMEAIPAGDLPQLLFSYLALCELCLFAPLLPQHAALRGPSFPLEQLLPALRFQRLLEAAQKITPMRGLRDHARYVTDLCQHLGWVHPLQMISAAVHGPERVADPRAQVYINAQRFRAQALFCHLDATGIMMDNSPPGVALRDNCTFLVVEYTDKTLFHRDKDHLQAMTTQHLFSQAMRHVLLGTDLRVPSPYRCTETERQALTVMLRRSLQETFAREFPLAEVI